MTSLEFDHFDRTGRHLEGTGAQEAAAREIASRGARGVLALAARDECRHALRGPLALLPRTVPSRQKSTCPDTV